MVRPWLDPLFQTEAPKFIQMWDLHGYTKWCFARLFASIPRMMNPSNRINLEWFQISNRHGIHDTWLFLSRPRQSHVSPRIERLTVGICWKTLGITGGVH